MAEDKPKRTLEDSDVVVERRKSARAVATIKGNTVEPPRPDDPARRGPGHGDPDH